MSDDKYDFLEPSSLFRFEFTASSFAWGITIGTLIAMHKFRNSCKCIIS